MPDQTIQPQSSPVNVIQLLREPAKVIPFPKSKRDLRERYPRFAHLGEDFLNRFARLLGEEVSA